MLVRSQKRVSVGDLSWPSRHLGPLSGRQIKERHSLTFRLPLAREARVIEQTVLD